MCNYNVNLHDSLVFSFPDEMETNTAKNLPQRHQARLHERPKNDDEHPGARFNLNTETSDGRLIVPNLTEGQTSEMETPA